MIPKDAIHALEEEWEACPLDISRFCVYPYLEPRQEEITVVRCSRRVVAINYKNGYNIGKRKTVIDGITMFTRQDKALISVGSHYVYLFLPLLLPNTKITIIGMTNYTMAVLRLTNELVCVSVANGVRTVDIRAMNLRNLVITTDSDESTVIRSTSNVKLYVIDMVTEKETLPTYININSQGSICEID